MKCWLVRFTYKAPWLIRPVPCKWGITVLREGLFLYLLIIWNNILSLYHWQFNSLRDNQHFIYWLLRITRMEKEQAFRGLFWLIVATGTFENKNYIFASFSPCKAHPRMRHHCQGFWPQPLMIPEQQLLTNHIGWHHMWAITCMPQDTILACDTCFQKQICNRQRKIMTIYPPHIHNIGSWRKPRWVSQITAITTGRGQSMVWVIDITL